MNEHLISSLKIVLAMIIVGSSVVAGKLIVQSFPVFLASELRFLIATIILFPILIKFEGFPSIGKRDLLILFLQALFGVFLFNIFMLYGLTITTAIEGGIITSTIPAVTGCLAFLFLREKLTKSVITGILLAVLGTLTINFSDSFTTVGRGSSPLLGNLLIFGAVISEALFIIFGKFIVQRVSPLAISTVVSIFGTILFLPFSLYEGNRFNFGEVSIAEWGLVFYFGIVVTVIAFILMYQGVSKVSASTAGVLTGVLPMSSVILSVVILGEKVSFIHLIGIGFTLTAIYLIAKPAKKTCSTNY
ncbi:DMT family transporter [Aneurinibacillus aneurinilyticus]|nr:DMT family transporter [Aneurinibacillus aneurinilyticus]MED0708881.1 DMT family transporter [Aneurinibacillus aneurinilyticus]MED0726253.1 DMT family transporter [Aneurinibacillus aneurinilyticus]MED0733623.1 DMT family transporter [Aneurinibacillus aneurinilyticus]MED0744214.1 DMT family transporter [Aneurinibacillus aneurinilyticus]